MMSNWLTADVSRRAWVMWRIEWHVFKKLWLSRIAWTFGEPVLYAVMFGWGFEPYIPSMTGLSYLQFLGPGLLIGYVMYTSCFECTYNTLSALREEQWLDAMMTTPLSARDIVGGIILWGTTRGLIIGLGMFLFCVVVGVVKGPWVVLTLPIVILTGMAFSAMGTWLTAYVKSFDHFNYLWGFYIAPAFIVTGIFFPMNSLPKWIQMLGWLFPTAYVVEPLRHVLVGTLTSNDGFRLVIMVVLTWGLWHGAVRAFSRRLIT